MPDTKVSDEVALLVLDGTEILYMVSALAPRRGTVDLIAAYCSAPPTNDGRALGSASLRWSDLFLANNGVINFNAGDITITHGTNTLVFAGASLGYSFDASIKPASNDGAALGSATVSWSDAFFASGAVFNFNNGDVVITHALNQLNFSGAAAGYRFDALIAPATSDGAPLGDPSLQWSDAYFASGAVHSWANGNVLLTHSSGAMTATGNWNFSSQLLEDDSTKVATTAFVHDFFPNNYISGLKLEYSNATSLNLYAGAAADAANAVIMIGLVRNKTTGAWAVGNGQGALDTGTVANSTWYHVYVIRRPDTGVVDYLYSTSATAPTMPANYTQKRRIGSFKTDGSAQIVPFVHEGDVFQWFTPIADVSATNPGIAAVDRTLSVPTGVRVRAKTFVNVLCPAQTDYPGAVYISDKTVGDVAASSTGAGSVEIFSGTAVSNANFGSTIFTLTNTSAQVRSRLQISAAGTLLTIVTLGWEDMRGKEG